MADVSAKIRVEADTLKARKDVSELGGDLVKVERAAVSARRAAGGGQGGGVSGMTVRDLAQRMIAEEYRQRFAGYKGDYRNKGKSQTEENPEDIGRRIAREFARIAGSSLAKFVVGYMSNQGLSTAFSLMRRPGRDSSGIDQVESTVNGAIQWGVAGAQIAGPMGAVVGSMMGGLNGFLSRMRDVGDAYRNAARSYKIDEKNRQWSLERGQESRIFDSVLNSKSPEERASMLRERAESMKGSGESARKYIKRYRNASADEKADMYLEMREAIDAELHNGGRLENGQMASIGGNAHGTKEYYETLWRGSQLLRENGSKVYDDKWQEMLKQRLDATRSTIDSSRELELGGYLGELERIRGMAGGRAAITDSASSKGLGVGAQIGSMQNERLLRGIDRVTRMIQAMGDKAVDAIRSQGGIQNAVTMAM